MPDLKQPQMTPRHVACNVVLQLHGRHDPDRSRELSERIVYAIDRAAGRGHPRATPTEDEVERCREELDRRGVPVTYEDAYAVMNHALFRGWA